jgi:hypothetical protein
MTLPPRILGAVALAATTATLAVPSMAGAVTPPKAGEKTYEQTYPMASRLCNEVTAGKRKRLQPPAIKAKVLADCTAVQSGFTAAQTTILATRAAITAAIATDRAPLATVCAKSIEARPLCQQTRRQTRRAVAKLRLELFHATLRYYRTIEANRLAFWHAIRGLPGQSHVRADSPILQLPA